MRAALLVERKVERMADLKAATMVASSAAELVD